MTSRERMMIALSNGRPDRLPCQVHGWMQYYMNRSLNGGRDQFEAYERFELDWAIYTNPSYRSDEREQANWQTDSRETHVDSDGNHHWAATITTPGGELHHKGSWNEITGWTTEYIIKTADDFELWNRYCPAPIAADFTEVAEAKKRMGDRGIIRSGPYSFGQGSPWQSLCTMIGTQEAIMIAMDEPDRMHHMLNVLLQRMIRAAELWPKNAPVDLVETGGGAGSSTVISPAMFREFCVPYDQQVHAAYHNAGVKIVYHLCGGLMPMLELVTQNGADGLETMTPVAMGGDCDLREASRRVGDTLFFIGGFDQNAGFERGDAATVRRLVHECFDATKDHAGYICCPSDHFFFGDPANVQAFARACAECRY